MIVSEKIKKLKADCLKVYISPSGCGRFGEDILPGVRGCGCGRGVCCRTQY